MHTFSLENGDISISVFAEELGDDLCVMVTGGRAHIGAVALSVARPSLRGDGGVGISTSILTMTGHKDDRVAKYVSEQLSKNLNRNVVSVCGIHYDNITPEGISRVTALAEEAAVKLARHFSGDANVYNIL